MAHVFAALDIDSFRFVLIADGVQVGRSWHSLQQSEISSQNRMLEVSCETLVTNRTVRSFADV